MEFEGWGYSGLHTGYEGYVPVDFAHVIVGNQAITVAECHPRQASAVHVWSCCQRVGVHTLGQVNSTEAGAGLIELFVQGAGKTAASIRLFDGARVDPYETVFSVETAADGLCAKLEDITVSVWDGMEEFFDGLARDFRGWEGARTWASNHLSVTATVGSGGLVYLAWTVRSGFSSEDWKCTVTTAIEAAEGIALVAVRLKGFLAQG